MADVFLSYKSEDRGLAARLAQALEREGLNVWWDRKVVAGGEWREAILREISAARVVIVAWSRRSEDANAAAWMLNELDEAARLRIPVIPVKLEPCEPPFGFRHIQAADLSDWRGARDHAEWREVMDGVDAALAGRRIDITVPAPRRRVRERERERKRGGWGAAAMGALTAVAALALLRAPPEAQPERATPTAIETPVVGAIPAPATENETQRRGVWRRFEPRAPVSGPIDGTNAEVVAFVGRGDVRGVFRRTRGDLWTERNSEAGRAGFYRVDHADARHIELHDTERNLWARIDFEAGVILIKNPGEADFQPRYRIVPSSG